MKVERKQFKVDDFLFPTRATSPAPYFRGRFRQNHTAKPNAIMTILIAL